MVKLKILGEKLTKATTAGMMCCWGGPDDGCDCTGGLNFEARSEVWLRRLEILLAP
jgi:hypothetical protein